MLDRFVNVRLVSYSITNNQQVCLLRIPKEGQNKKILEDFEIEMVDSFYDLQIYVFGNYNNLDEFVLSEYIQCLSIPFTVCGVKNDTSIQKNTPASIGQWQTNYEYLAFIMIEYFEPIVDGRSYQK